MNPQHDITTLKKLDPETLKKAQLYQLIEELVLSEHARMQAEEHRHSISDKRHVVKDPAGHGG